MAAADSTAGDITRGTSPTVLSGYWRSCWLTLHSDTDATANTAAQLKNPTTTGLSTNVKSVIIPFGATRCVFRQKTGTSVTGSTTVAVCQAFVLDENGIPARIDAAANTAAGFSLTFNTTISNNLTDGTFYYGDLVSIAGLDTMGGNKLITLIETAAAHTAATQEVQGLFLNG